MLDIVKHNRKAWNNEVEIKNQWTIPVSHEIIEKAKNGEWTVVLTPLKPVPREWFPEEMNGAKILCLASGGGQQGPILAAAGADVTVFDNSDNQLESDRIVAKRENLHIKTVQGDMKDLSAFEDESFDMIYHPVSNCFVDDVQPVWNECFRVLKKGGTLVAGINNPLIYMFDMELYEKGILQIKYPLPYADVIHLEKEKLEKMIENNEPLEFGHTLEQQIGGLIKAGFIINGFGEDSWEKVGILNKYSNSFYRIRAKKM